MPDEILHKVIGEFFHISREIHKRNQFVMMVIRNDDVFRVPSDVDNLKEMMKSDEFRELRLY